MWTGWGTGASYWAPRRGRHLLWLLQNYFRLEVWASIWIESKIQRGQIHHWIGSHDQGERLGERELRCDPVSPVWSRPPIFRLLRCWAHHDKLISMSYPYSQGRVYLFHSVADFGCGPAKEQALLFRLITVADIYCDYNKNYFLLELHQSQWHLCGANSSSSWLKWWWTTLGNLNTGVLYILRLLSLSNTSMTNPQRWSGIQVVSMQPR